MKSIFVIGSRKFYREIEKFVQLCKRNGFKVSVVGKWDKKQEDTLKSEKKELISSEKIGELSAQVLISKIMKSKELISIVNEQVCNRVSESH